MTILVPTASGRKDKNDALLQEFVAAKNWKQALNHCEKRIKKGEKSDRLLMNKASILLHTDDPAKEAQGFEELRLLVTRKPPITDTGLLVALGGICKDIPELGHDANNWVDICWERAANDNPKDEKFLELWFETKFSERNYKAAQKAAWVYSMKFKNKRRPYFWTILASYLASSSLDVTVTERVFFADLAHRLLSTAAALARSEAKEAAPAGLSLASLQIHGPKEASESSRALRDPSDLQLLVGIYRQQGRYQDALAILDDPKIGIGSSIGLSSWELIRERIELTELCKEWGQLWRDCHDLLVRAGPTGSGDDDDETPPKVDAGSFGNDWAVWTAFIKAASHLRGQDCPKQTKAVITSYLQHNRKSRNARHALIVFYGSGPESIANDPDDLLSVLLAYYYDFYASPICFHDLFDATLLPKSQQCEFVSKIARHAEALEHSDADGESTRAAWLLAEINSLKEDYFLIASVQDKYKSPELLEYFISNCLRLYKLSLPLGNDLPVSERRPGDDAAIMAATACIHLFEGGERRALLRCVAILEILLSNSSHNYDALLMVVRVQLYLGMVSKGMIHYSRLDIKHNQYLTNAWILFTRISTLHPHSLANGAHGSNRMLNPAMLLKSALAWADKNEAMTKPGVAKFLEYDSLVNLVKYLDYSKKAKVGLMTRKQLVVEMERIGRLGHIKIDLDRTLFNERFDPNVEDLRNKSSFPCYEAIGQPRFEHYIQPGPNPGATWLLAQLEAIRLSQAISGQYSGHPSDVSTLSKDDMTIEESSAWEWNRHLLRIHCMAVECPADERKLYTKALTALLENLTLKTMPWSHIAEHLLKDSEYMTLRYSPKFFAPNWQYFHAIYTFMDQCTLTAAFLHSVAALNRMSGYFPDQKLLDERAMAFESTINRLYNDFHCAASKLRGILGTQEANDGLRNAIFGKADDCDDLVGIELRKFDEDGGKGDILCAGLLESLRECLDGIIKTDNRFSHRP